MSHHTLSTYVRHASDAIGNKQPGTALRLAGSVPVLTFYTCSAAYRLLLRSACR